MANEPDGADSSIKSGSYSQTLTPYGPKRQLFLCGVARSGTTAATDLLNIHSAIALGIERYKYLYGRNLELDHSLFERPRFFDFRETDTNITPKTRFGEAYDRLERKFDRATFIGDKLPRLYQFYDQIAAAFPSARFIYLIRHPVPVASSWQVRANDGKDSWPNKNNYLEAINEWNRANLLTSRYRKANAEKIKVVEYEQLFSGDDFTLRQIFDWLKIPATPKVLAYYKTKCIPEAVKRSKKKSALTVDQQAEVAQLADSGVAASLLN
jgi:hypothetical protein